MLNPTFVDVPSGRKAPLFGIEIGTNYDFPYVICFLKNLDCPAKDESGVRGWAAFGTNVSHISGKIFSAISRTIKFTLLLFSQSQRKIIKKYIVTASYE